MSTPRWWPTLARPATGPLDRDRQRRETLAAVRRLFALVVEEHGDVRLVPRPEFASLPGMQRVSVVAGMAASVLGVLVVHRLGRPASPEAVRWALGELEREAEKLRREAAAPHHAPVRARHLRLVR